MLIIKRKCGEALKLGEDIEVVVLDCENGAVKIGINAPKDIVILRSELISEVKNENENAINFDLEDLRNLNINKK